jgi:protein SSD1
MLPHILSETLCSLNPGADKLTFSVVFTMTPDAKIVSTWFGKALIRYVLSLSYFLHRADGGGV